MSGPPYEPAPDEYLRTQWNAHFAGYDNTDSVFDQLLAAYRTPGRYYHTIEHGLEVASTVQMLADTRPAADRDDLRLAAWVHDAHFEPDNDDNEERSALLAERLALQLAIGPERSRRVAELVHVSSHTVRPADELEAMMCDADLATLAKPWEAYTADVANIRAELRIDDDTVWPEVRLTMLSFFEKKTPLYHGSKATETWEAAAIGNRLREQDLLERRRVQNE